MKQVRAWMYLLPVASLATAWLWQVVPAHGFGRPSTTRRAWDESAAAKYLDDRAAWWQSWPKAQADHGTVCISCHTTVPYMMVRPALRFALHQSAPAASEDAIIASVNNRVSHWADMLPFYSDAENGPGKTAESHSTEAVMNAVILLSYDKSLGRAHPLTRVALDNAWALQYQTGDTAGGWLWQDFHLAPWESAESGYQGAALLMLELASASPAFINTPQDIKHLHLLQTYLKDHYAAQPPLNQIYFYWAAKGTGLLSPSERAELVQKIDALQQPDGGWTLSSLDKLERRDHSPQPSTSDAYATALVTLALQSNIADNRNASLDRGLLWLAQNQGKDGRWQSYSLNKQRDPESNIGKFMSDTATAFAVLALEQPAANPTP